MDEHAGDTVKDLCSVADQLVLLEKRGVPPVVGNEAGKAQAELGILVARTWGMAGVSNT